MQFNDGYLATLAMNIEYLNRFCFLLDMFCSLAFAPLIFCYANLAARWASTNSVSQSLLWIHWGSRFLFHYRSVDRSGSLESNWIASCLRSDHRGRKFQPRSRIIMCVEVGADLSVKQKGKRESRVGPNSLYMDHCPQCQQRYASAQTYTNTQLAYLSRD